MLSCHSICEPVFGGIAVCIYVCLNCVVNCEREKDPFGMLNNSLSWKSTAAALCAKHETPSKIQIEA